MSQVVNDAMRESDYKVGDYVLEMTAEGRPAYLLEITGKQYVNGELYEITTRNTSEDSTDEPIPLMRYGVDHSRRTGHMHLIPADMTGLMDKITAALD